MSLFGILAHVVQVVVSAVVAGFEDGSEGVLCGVGGAGADGIDGAVDHGAAQARIAEVGDEVRELAGTELVGDGQHGDTLTGVAECLGSGDHQCVIVGVFANSRLERRHAGFGDIATEVHAEVGEVFNHAHIVLGGQFADGTQFLVGEANP